jgi:hypothetical protein
MAVALGGWGCHAWFSSRAGAWLRRWPLLAEIALRALAMAIAVAAVLVGLQPVLYGEPLEAKWFQATFPGTFAAAFVLSIAFCALLELVRLIGGRVLLSVILGRYRHPIREERVLMFLDLAGSTARPYRWARCACRNCSRASSSTSTSRSWRMAARCTPMWATR